MKFRMLFRFCIPLIVIIVTARLDAANVLNLHFVKNAESRFAVCNDGTDAGYYLRRGTGTGSKRWVIFLVGGGFCNSISSCAERARTSPDLMSSNFLPQKVKTNAKGLLSSSA